MVAKLTIKINLFYPFFMININIHNSKQCNINSLISKCCCHTIGHDLLYDLFVCGKFKHILI